MVNLTPAGDYVPRGQVAGGVPAQRPDQRLQPLSRAGVGPAPQQTVFIGRLVIISGSGGAVSGLFIYSGTPGPGNPPILAAVPPGVTTDPYGNAVQGTLMVGSNAGPNTRLDGTTGRVNFNDSTGLTKIRIDPGNEMIGWYPTGSGLGRLAMSISAAAGTDASGNTIDAGIMMSSLPVLIYNGTAGAGDLSASAAPTAGTDAFGNKYLAGIASYSGTSIAAEINAAALNFLSLTSTPNVAPTIFSTVASASGTEVNLSSGKGTPGAAAMTLSLFDSLAGFGVAQAAIGAGTSPIVTATTALLEVQGSTALKNAAAPGSVAGYAEPFASSGHLDYVSSDGSTYDTGRLTQVVTSAQLVNSVTAANVLSFPNLAASATYEIEGEIYYTPAGAAGASVWSWLTGVGFTTFTISMIEFTATLGTSAAGAGFGDGALMNARTNTLTGSTFGAASRILKISGTLVTSGANSIALQAACTIAADTYTILAGSKLKLLPVVA